jgi:hypothetical protein
MGRSILFLCILCSACVSNEEYPDDWPPIVVGDTECPDISGIYYDHGVSASANEYRLSDYLYGISPSEGFIMEYVVISQSDADEIQTTIHHMHRMYDTTHKSYETHTLSRELGHFVCEDGKIWITQTGWAVPYGVARFKDRIGLAKAEGGSLIGEQQSSGAGVALFVVPFKLSSHDYVLWSRFEPIWRDVMQRVIEKKVNTK